MLLIAYTPVEPKYILFVSVTTGNQTEILSGVGMSSA